VSKQCRILKISQLYRPPRSVTGIALLFFFFYFYSYQSIVSPVCMNLRLNIHSLERYFTSVSTGLQWRSICSKYLKPLFVLGADVMQKTIVLQFICTFLFLFILFCSVISARTVLVVNWPYSLQGFHLYLSTAVLNALERIYLIFFWNLLYTACIGIQHFFSYFVWKLRIGSTYPWYKPSFSVFNFFRQHGFTF
jgi:hypothetical protein